MELLSWQQRGRKESENLMHSSHHSESGLSPQDLAGDLRGGACPRAVGVSAAPRPGLSVPAPGSGYSLGSGLCWGRGAAGIVGCRPQRITDTHPTVHIAQRALVSTHVHVHAHTSSHLCV